MPWIIAAAFAVTMQEAQACSMNVTGVNFGSYDVFSKAALHSTGNININCPNGVGYTIGLSAGSGTYQQRGMSSGTPHSQLQPLYRRQPRRRVGRCHQRRSYRKWQRYRYERKSCGLRPHPTSPERSCGKLQRYCQFNNNFLTKYLYLAPSKSAF